MRGAWQWHDVCLHTVRIIPADAGSTVTTFDASIMAEDHPRGCGEHMLMVIGVADCEGSSPRMRGALI